MSGTWEQIPESFIQELERKRRRLVEAQEENGVNLDALVDFLYPDTAHLVFELLQNAEDAGATSARFQLGQTKLSFTHDGRPFAEKDLDSITNYFKSAKYETEDTIGRFGIGFKSVFGCTETPKIFSDTVAFKIVDRIVPKAIPRPVSSVRLSNCETVFELPFNGRMKTQDEVREEIWLGLAEMSTMSVLHLRSIRSIEWRADDGSSGWIKRTELDDGVVQVDAKRLNGEDTRYFLRFREPYAEGSSMHLDVVFELQEKEPDQRTLAVDSEALHRRFRIIPAERGSVAVFFAAQKETSNLRFHLHAPFIPELSRASIKRHADNAALMSRLAALLAKSLPTIRDLGLLDREFLGVLPNSRDPLPEAYEPFHHAVTQAMRSEPLVPMQGGGHESATRLLQGPADVKEYLGVEDIRFLMSGWDYKRPTYFDSRRRVVRSPQPSPCYRGWSVSATQRNTAVDHLLGDLMIGEFLIDLLVPPESETEEAITEWLATHDAAWHRTYYASIDRHWDASNGAYEGLSGLPVIRTRSGEHRPAVECHFADGLDDAPEGITIADPNTYSGGRGSKAAREALERLGVREIDDESKVIGILEKHYGESQRRPTWEEHIRHVESFIGLVQEGLVAASTFREYRFLLDHEEDWLRPNQLYAGGDHPGSSVAPYYECLEWLIGDAEPYEIDSRYQNIHGFDEFARGIGVIYSLSIEPTMCSRNPKSEHLRSGGGVNFTTYGTDRDWQVPYLDDLIRRLQQTDHLENERRMLARAIQVALAETTKDTWPPPDPCFSELLVTGKLVAVFRRNAKADFRAAPSQLVFTLRKHAWVPQKQDRDGLVFVTPGKARPDLLPDGFAFDFGWAWVKAVGFGSESGEAELDEAPLERDREDREEKAKDLGFEDLQAAEDGKWFAGLAASEKQEIKRRHEAEHRAPPEFAKPRDPEGRRAKAKELAEVAPRRTTERMERSIVAGEDNLKEEARTKLRAEYEEHAHVSLCQVAGCQDRSFKLKGGTWYFEAVRFLGLEKMIAEDYVALCPRHAAMFQHARESDGLNQEFAGRCSGANDGRSVLIPIVLAGENENMDILLAPKHAIDLKAALDVDAEQDAESD